MDLDYSDGLEIEREIEKLLVEARDLKSSSSIAHARYNEWPVRYHLCPERANLLRHLNFKELDVLELGAGMGAVSRFLAENSKTLTVVEGTEQRFRALSERLRDLSNWKGQVANIAEVELKETFDAVVVVGALEYSELFIKQGAGGESPFQVFLKKAKSFLKPGGVLILAIENRLGLKYFNGAPEDHTSHPYDGISGYPLSKSPKTFSRKELLALFESTGFSTFQEYFPFPDYKMPTSVLTKTVCITEPTLASNLAAHTEFPQNHWNPLLGTKAVAEAGILPDLANSFLVVCSESSDSPVLRKLLPHASEIAWHYSSNRKSLTCTRFLRDQATLKTIKNELGNPFQSSLVRWTPRQFETVKTGIPVREWILRKGYFEGYEGWSIALRSYIGWALQTFSVSTTHLNAEALDAVYSNAVQTKDGFECFDLEWTYSQNIPKSWFILRNLLSLYKDIQTLPLPGETKTIEKLYLNLCTGFSILPNLKEDIERESEIQSEITPESSKDAYRNALNARTTQVLGRSIKRRSIGEIENFNHRLNSILSRFPDFLSALDRPSTKLLLTIDQKLRENKVFKKIYKKVLSLTKKLYRLLPATYKIIGNESNTDGTNVFNLKRLWGASPKVGWVLATVRLDSDSKVKKPVSLRLELPNGNFSIPLSTVKKKNSRIIRLHDSANNVALVSKEPPQSIQRIYTRNLTKAEVFLRIVIPQLLYHFAWRNEFEKLKAYWKQGKFRGAVAYAYSLVQKADIGYVEAYADWTNKFDRLKDTDRELIRKEMNGFSYQPKISILMPVFNTPTQWLEKAIESVLKQLYPNWELCIADDASTSQETIELLKKYEGTDPRIKIVRRNENGHISLASNSALELATGSYIGILDHDDELHETALYHVVRELDRNNDLKLLYSDEDKLDTANRRYLPHFKTDWNPELFYCYNLITHFTVIDSALVKAVGAFRVGYEGSQDYDLFLRCIELLEPFQIKHIPFVLYHWRALENSTSGHQAAKPYAKVAALKALNEHLERKKIKAKVVEGFNDCFRIKYELPETLPKVSVIICTKDREDLLRTIVNGVRKETDYSNLEFIIVNNQSTDPKTLKYLEELKQNSNTKVINYDESFNFAAMNNLAANAATGEVLAFLNNDLKIIQKDWLKEMVSFAIQPHVGAVGAKLLYPSGRLQHGGVILGIGGVAGHSHKGFGPHQSDFYARTHVSQCLSAVTAACLVIRRNIFDEVKGFDEENLKVAFNDVDLCLKIREKGYSNIWTPWAELIHFESESRGSDQRPETFPRFQRETNFMKEKWGIKLKQDPFYNPNLTLQKEDFDIAFPPRITKPWKQVKITPSHV